jgi:hypothetical protein
VKWTAVDPIKSARRQIDTAVERRVNLETEAARQALEMRAWQDRTARTLHANPEDARRIFRTEIDRLAQEHGLTDGLRLGDGTPQRLNSEGFVALPVSIRCTGNSKSVLDFLVAFYRLPYLARITGVTLTANEVILPRGRGRDNTPPPEPRLTVSLNASALVLPVLKDVKGQRHGEYASVTDVQRLKREADYARLFERNIFAKWTPKPAVVVKTPEAPKTEPPPGRRHTPPAPPPDPRRDADKLRVAMCESLNGVPYVLVYDERKPEEPPTEHRLESPIDDGTLVLVQPRGIVVRAQEEKDGASRTAYFFYELGKTFKERAEVTPESHPEIAAELNLVSAQ